ncbi:oxidoreductase [Lasius niger]|uniref:Oxidoreductase n=1 Tax=Lasius niger TaxID=67767 RepID=A0A0J7KXK8_LASNI|nr:oxidoreductase [Lasius niger]
MAEDLTHNEIQIGGLPSSVLRIALGTWAIGGWMWGGSDDNLAIKTIHDAVANGINLIDTAPVYGFGHSEEVVGKALSTLSEKPFIATKVGLSWDNGKVYRDSRPEIIRQGVEDSLKRLGVETIALAQVHWPDLNTPIEETAAELAKLRQEGKILSLGVSNYSTAQMKIFQQAAPLSTSQDPLNIFERATEKTTLPFVKENDMALLAYGPLCRGLLSGKITADSVFSGDDLRKSDPKFQAPRFEEYLKAVKELQALADEKGKSLLALAIRWVLDLGPTIALWGARKPEQVTNIRDALDWSLTAEDYQKISDILARDTPDPIEPTFMAPPER